MAVPPSPQPQLLPPLSSLPPQSPQALGRLGVLQVQLMQQHALLWSSMFAGSGVPEGIGQAEAGDRRFSSKAWGADPFHDYVRRSYLLNARFSIQAIEALEMDDTTRLRLRFAAQQMVDALSPANFAATNPDVIELALQTQGKSIAEGVGMLIADVQKGRISTNDDSQFEVGRNLATTPGAVVYENEVVQLIQYAPSTPSVRKRPLLIVPPCINKFYVLDLKPENSFVRHAVGQGQTVFMLSWKNVLEDQQTLTWDDYIRDGLLAPIEAVLAISKVDKINALGFCVGGTMLCSALAVMAAKGEDKVQSLTLLASLLDFTEVGDIGAFVDETSVVARETTIGNPGTGGIMPGRELAMVFSALRANDLIWSYVVNSYLKGRQPQAFDILYWNDDSTNLPGPMYCWYLRNMYLEDKLREPGKLRMLGEAVDVGRLTMPAYLLATREDHIVPWTGAYRSAQLLRGETRFVLGASGHIAGVVNPAIANKRSYWVSSGLGESCPPDSQDWLSAASEQKGSWWNDWSRWLEPHSGPKIKAKKTLGAQGYRPIEDAPGRYVMRRVV